jgi:23S rRNA pseudouridine955/2504/2580 synthase
MHKIVKDDDDQIRLDRWLRENIKNASYTNIQKIIRTGQVRVGGRRKKPDYRVLTGDIIRIPPDQIDTEVLLKEDSDYHTRSIRGMQIYEDKHVLVINKPYGLATQGGTGINIHVDGMLRDSNNEISNKYRLIHRLDKHTTGVLMIAKRREVAQFYMSAFKNHKIKKQYIALVDGKPSNRNGEIDIEIVSKSQKRGDIVDYHRQQNAVTKYKLIDSHEDMISLLKIHPLTGRKHQIRKHLTLIGHPIIGDMKYGNIKIKAGLEKKLYLHAQKLVFPSFKSEEKIIVSGEIPIHFNKAIKLLKLNLDE